LSNAKFCSQCGAALEEGQYCPSCGHSNSDNLPSSNVNKARNVNFFSAIKLGFVNYFKFSGRATRSEYWWWALFILPLTLASYAFDAMESGSIVTLLIYVVDVSLVIPTIALLVRRLHDTGRSAWWILLTFVPFIGPLVLLVFTVRSGEEYRNKYGPDPRRLRGAPGHP